MTLCQPHSEVLKVLRKIIFEYRCLIENVPVKYDYDAPCMLYNH